MSADVKYVPQLSGIQMSKLNTILNGGGFVELTGAQIAKLRELLERPEQEETTTEPEPEVPTDNPSNGPSIPVNTEVPITSEDEIL